MTETNGLSQTQILFVADKAPFPVVSGLDLRVQSLLEAAQQLGQVTQIFNSDLQAEDSLLGPLQTQQNSRQVQPFASSLENPHDLYAFYRTPRSMGRLKRILATWRPSVVIFSRLKTTAYLNEIKSLVNAHMVIDLDETMSFLGSALSPLGKSRGHRLLSRFFYSAEAAYERVVINEADTLLVSSEIELAHLRKISNKSAAVVVNAVSIPSRTLDIQERNRDQLFFPGNFAYPPNLAATSELLEKILPRLSWAELLISGSYLPKWLSDCANSRVEVVANPRYMQPYFQRTGMLVAPIRTGGGTRLKILEAMANRTPVVATAKAVEGLQVIPEVHFLQGDSDTEIANQCERIRYDDSVWERLTTNAWDFVNRNHSKDVVTRQLRAALS